MSTTLYVKNDAETTALMDRLAFTQDANNRYLVDEVILDRLDLAGERPDGYRPVAIHVVPYTKVDGQINYFVFDAQGQTVVYISFPIEKTDFIAHKHEDEVFSICQTLVGKIIRTFDQPHIDMTLDISRFMFPSVVNGEFVWAVEIAGDNVVVVDELVGHFGTVAWRIAQADMKTHPEWFNPLCNAIAQHEAVDHGKA